MDYDTLLRDTWDRIMQRFLMDQLNDSIGSSLPDISDSFDSELQFDMELEENSESNYQANVTNSDNQVNTAHDIPESNIDIEHDKNEVGSLSSEDVGTSDDVADNVSEQDTDSKVDTFGNFL